MKRLLRGQNVQAAPYLVWNAFVNILAKEQSADLTPIQQAAQHVFWYEHEVQNGGHFQYFENRSHKDAAETIGALGELNATCQQQVLREALAQWTTRLRPNVETIEEFCVEGLEGGFAPFDSRIHQCSPSLVECLEQYLERHQDEFVRIE
jgi:hypothetical protein